MIVLASDAINFAIYTIALGFSIMLVLLGLADFIKATKYSHRYNSADFAEPQIEEDNK